MPFNPDATHSHQPRYPSLAPLRGHCGLSAAAVEDAGVIRAARNRRFGCTGAAPGGARSGKRGWCSPSPVAAEAGVAGFGSGLPSIPASQPLLSRRRRTVTPKVSPPGAAFKERVALRRHPGGRAVAAECATPTPSLIRLRRTGGTPSLRSPMRCSLRSPVYRRGPRRACFVLRRRAGPRSLRKLVCAGVALRAPWKDSTSPDNTTNNQTHLPQDRQDPHPHGPDPDPDASPTTPLCA